MVLMNASFNLALPDMASAKLVIVPAFVHQHVAASQAIALKVVNRNRNRRDVLQIQVAGLNVRFAKVRNLHRFAAHVIFAVRDAKLNIRDES